MAFCLIGSDSYRIWLLADSGARQAIRVSCIGVASATIAVTRPSRRSTNKYAWLSASFSLAEQFDAQIKLFTI